MVSTSYERSAMSALSVIGTQLSLSVPTTETITGSEAARPVASTSRFLAAQLPTARSHAYEKRSPGATPAASTLSARALGKAPDPSPIWMSGVAGAVCGEPCVSCSRRAPGILCEPGGR